MSFRTKLLVAMMVVVASVTALALYFAEHSLVEAAETDLQREFQAELAALHHLQEIRHAALVERCHALVRKPRIHAALEDGALDLLYPNAEDELRDIMIRDRDAPPPGTLGLQAKFYRFLDRHGAVIPTDRSAAIGALSPELEARLALPKVPDRPQLGFLADLTTHDSASVTEIIAMPVISGETGEVIAALVLGFRPEVLNPTRLGAGITRGLWLNGRLHLSTLAPAAQAALSVAVNAALTDFGRAEGDVRVQIGGVPHLLFYKQLNGGSLFPPALEVCSYPLTELLSRQRTMRWRVLGAGALLLLGGFAASGVLSTRFSKPVEKLEVDSAEHLAQRARVEAALEATHAELQRAARFSADASHQLKTPVTVLRAGLEELLTHDHLTPRECHEISALIHQTYRLSSVIEDLLLLSRLDAGRLKLELKPVNLSALIEASVDDLSALPDALKLEVETDFPPDVHIAGEKRYTALILQNLLENAHKYNRPGGRIRLTAHLSDGAVQFVVGNTGKPIPPEAQTHIFERFHRGSVGEDVPGYGLGLNLARELARLHGGDLQLARSDATWTEFSVRFRAMAGPA